MISRSAMAPLLVGLCLGALPATRAAAALSAEEQRLMAASESGSETFAADLGQAVQINSATENLAGVREMGELFGRQLTELGFESRFIPQPAGSGRAGHLVAEHRGTMGRRLLLIGHLDTVYPGANFKRDGSKVWGAGVGDMKGGDLVILHALRALHRAGLLAGTRIIVIMTGDEEAPGEPLAVSRRELLEVAKRSDVALAFESAIGSTGTVARRGYMKWELEVQGPTGHSSGMFSAAVGSGAVYETARILAAFHDEMRKMDGITMNPAQIVGGADVALTRTGGTTAGKDNIIAQRVLVRGDLRFLSAEQVTEAQAKLQEIVAKHLPRTSAVLTFHESNPAMPPTPANYALLAELDRASRDLGYGEITAFDPRSRGAGDISFVSPPLPGLDGLGLGGKGEHTTKEESDVTRAPELIKRTALMIYRMTRDRD